MDQVYIEPLYRNNASLQYRVLRLALYLHVILASTFVQQLHTVYEN